MEWVEGAGGGKFKGIGEQVLKDTSGDGDTQQY